MQRFLKPICSRYSFRCFHTSQATKQFDDMISEIKQFEQQMDLKISENDVQQNPCVVRFDGKRFSQFTKPFIKPFDPNLHLALLMATMDVMTEFSNFSSAYLCSDEVSLFMPPIEEMRKEHSRDQPFSMYYSGRVQKMSSVLASIMSVRFNYHLQHSTLFSQPNWKDSYQQYLQEFYSLSPKPPFKSPKEQIKELEETVHSMKAFFDARVFCLPKQWVGKYLFWRSNIDCVRNSKTSLGHCFLTPSQLHNTSSEAVVQTIKSKFAISYHAFPQAYKTGSMIQKELFERKGFNPIEDAETVRKRKRYCAKPFAMRWDENIYPKMMSAVSDTTMPEMLLQDRNIAVPGVLDFSYTLKSVKV